MDVASIAVGIALGGTLVVAGIIQMLYPEKSYRALAGWQFDESPGLSIAGRLDRRGFGLGLIVIGLMLAYHFIR